jgi:hypothetical protein
MKAMLGLNVLLEIASANKPAFARARDLQSSNFEDAVVASLAEALHVISSLLATFPNEFLRAISRPAWGVRFILLKAAGYFTRVLALDPKFVPAYGNLAFIAAAGYVEASNGGNCTNKRWQVCNQMKHLVHFGTNSLPFVKLNLLMFWLARAA